MSSSTIPATRSPPSVPPPSGSRRSTAPATRHASRRAPDVLTYTTSVLTEDIEVTGPIAATLFAATEARDTDWIIKLVDVHPDGRAFNLTDGAVRARYRNGPEELLEPGQVYEYQLDMQVTSNVFKRGHRIRIQISSTDFPRLHRNPNTGDPLLDDAALIPVLQTVLHDTEHPSRDHPAGDPTLTADR